MLNFFKDCFFFVSKDYLKCNLALIQTLIKYLNGLKRNIMAFRKKDIQIIKLFKWNERIINN